MAQDEGKPSGSDLTKGVPLTALADKEIMLGRVGDEDVLLVRRGDEVFAIGAHCTHYHGPLAEGLLVGDTVRCPWHHATFDLRTGEAVRTPAFNPVPCWNVALRDGQLLRHRQKAAETSAAPRVERGRSARADRHRGRRRRRTRRRRNAPARRLPGKLAMIEQRRRAAGRSPEPVQGLPRRQRPGGLDAAASDDCYREQRDRAAAENERRRHRSTFAQSRAREGSEARRTTRCCWRPAPSRYGSTCRAPTSRTSAPCAHWADCRAIIDAAQAASRAVVIGASFIGLEVAASLRARKLEVDVVAPEKRPLENVFGPEIGDFVRSLHEEHGVMFHLEDTATAIDGKSVTLKSGDDRGGGSGGGGHRRAPAHRACRAGGARHRQRRLRERIPGDERARASSPRATSRAGPIRTQAKTSASSIGSSPSARAKPRRGICWAHARRSTRRAVLLEPAL